MEIFSEFKVMSSKTIAKFLICMAPVMGKTIIDFVNYCYVVLVNLFQCNVTKSNLQFFEFFSKNISYFYKIYL